MPVRHIKEKIDFSDRSLARTATTWPSLQRLWNTKTWSKFRLIDYNSCNNGQEGINKNRYQLTHFWCCWLRIPSLFEISSYKDFILWENISFSSPSLLQPSQSWLFCPASSSDISFLRAIMTVWSAWIFCCSSSMIFCFKTISWFGINSYWSSSIELFFSPSCANSN